MGRCYNLPKYVGNGEREGGTETERENDGAHNALIDFFFGGEDSFIFD